MVVNAVVLVLVPDLTVTEAVVYPVAAAWAAGMPSRPAPVTVSSVVAEAAATRLRRVDRMVKRIPVSVQSD